MEAKTRTSKKHCLVCKFKIRGKQHKKGDHHLEALRKQESN